MSFSVGTQPEQLPIIEEPTLIINQGTVNLLLGNSRGVLSSYGATLAPGNSFVYDLSTQRYIRSASGLCAYDLLSGASAAIPGADAIASSLNASGLALAIATQILATGVRQIDVPVLLASGNAQSVQPTGLQLGGVNGFDVTAYQSIEFTTRYDTVAAFPAAGDWFVYQLLWFDASGTQLLWVDTVEHISTAEPSGTFTGKSTFVTAPVRGARLFIFSGAGSVGSTCTYGLWASNRPVNRFTIKQDTTQFTCTDQIISAGQIIPGATTTTQTFIPVFSGEAYMRIVSVGTIGQTVRVQILMGSPAQSVYDVTHTINTTPEDRLIIKMPRRGWRMSVQNIGAGAANGIRYAIVGEEP